MRACSGGNGPEQLGCMSWPGLGPRMEPEEAGDGRWGKRLQCWPHPSLLHCHLTMALRFCGSPGFCHEHSWLQHPTLQPLQAVSTQPPTVLSPGLSSKPCVPAPSPCPYQWTCLSGWGVQSGDTDCLCRSLSVLPATN